jgi:uncharacterized membrane protein
VRSRAGPEPGQTSLVLVGFFVVVALLVVVVVDASAAYLRRQRLDSLADGAALAAADGIRSEQLYVGGLGEQAILDAEAARSFAAEYLARTTAGRYAGLRWTLRTTADTVEVQVSAPLELPIAPPGWRGSVVTARAAAYVAVSD